MTRKIAKSVKLSTIVALIVLMAMAGFLADNQAQADLDEFDKLLDGIEAEVSSTKGAIKPTPDTAETLPTEFITAQHAYLEAFDEVIRNQFL